MKHSHQNFLACVILHLLIPLAPLLIEYVYDTDIALKSVVLAGAMYSFSIALTSNQVGTFSICLAVGFLLSASYGAVEANSSAMPLYKSLPVYVILVVLVINVFERFDRHVNKGEIFFLFEPKRGV